MPVKVEIVRALEAHAHMLAPRLRAEDAEEIRAGGFASGLDGLLHSLAVSTEAYALMLNGEVAALFGASVRNALTGEGSVWLLTSDLADRYRFAFVRTLRAATKYIMGRWPQLVGLVDSRYDKAIRFVERLGFQVGEPMPYGPMGLMFRPIERREK